MTTAVRRGNSYKVQGRGRPSAPRGLSLQTTSVWRRPARPEAARRRHRPGALTSPPLPLSNPAPTHRCLRGTALLGTLAPCEGRHSCCRSQITSRPHPVYQPSRRRPTITGSACSKPRGLLRGRPGSLNERRRTRSTCETQSRCSSVLKISSENLSDSHKKDSPRNGWKKVTPSWKRMP